MEAADRVRTQCLRNFTRSLNSFDGLVKRKISIDLITAAFNKLQTSYEKLEVAQDEFVAVATDGAEIVDYLDEPSVKFQTALIEYGELQQKSTVEQREILQGQAEENQRIEEDRRAREEEGAKRVEASRLEAEKEVRLEAAIAEFNSGVAVFRRKIDSIRGVVAEASDADKREALRKLEIDFEDMRGKLVVLGGISKQDQYQECNEKFVRDAETPFIATQKWFLLQLKDSQTAPLPTIAASVSSATSVSSNTKKEAVTLPSFKGDLSSSPSPYVMYPSWRSRWDLLIAEYEPKFRVNFLLERLDSDALEKVSGYEQDYSGAMKRLDSFYGDPLKVVSCIMSAVNAPLAISEGDYHGLITYSGVLEQNYNRLKCMELDHEMSNTSSMTMIIRKFPNSVAEKWAEHIVAQNAAAKAKPFPVFIEWLVSQKQIWERMAAVESTKGTEKGDNYFAGGTFAGGAKPKGDKQITCYKCGAQGHKRNECPATKSKGDGQKKGGRKKTSKPSYKKFWCAFHKDDPSKNCDSISCQDLRRTDANTRIELLKANKDCMHCCGDHDSVNCNKKGRICVW